MRFAVETWSPEYGVAADQGTLIESSATVDAGVEVALEGWAPISVADDVALPESIGFVDGVRRIDARVWITDGDLARPGVCATVAAGLTVCTGRRASVADAVVQRGLYTSVGGGGVGPIVTRHGTYELFPTADDTPESLYLGVHDQMTKLELDLSDQAGCEVMVFDGPLRGRYQGNGVGYVKTQHVQYLPDEAQAVLGQLGSGERTPLFLIDQRGFTRWSWYLRLPGRVAHPLSGVVRCELPGTGTVTEAVTRAESMTALLPRFASEPHKDARAPQNLYPIAGLENDLRRRLGDQLLMDRALRMAAAAAAEPGI